ncbi:MAG TPA: hypothetical protein VGD37_26470 [Kofleriaceae bacterium]
MSNQPSDPAPTAAQLFEQLRETLEDVLGTAATATFLRRSARRAAGRYPELAGVGITKQRLDYEYVLPQRWFDTHADTAALTAWVAELEHLLADLTGAVMIRKLRSVPALTSAGLFRPEGA